jgi:hypothetical protein
MHRLHYRIALITKKTLYAALVLALCLAAAGVGGFIGHMRAESMAWAMTQR